MRKIILASHGHLADGLKSSVELIAGEQKNIYTINAYEDEDFDLKSTIKNLFSNFSSNDEVIVITDVYGGSVNNEFLVCLNEFSFSLVTGMNLPLVLELLGKNNTPTDLAITESLTSAKNAQVYFNQFEELSDEEF
ncbi:MAG: PTS sugar transporter subunit IIA [Enterococcus avium]